jgi:DNA-binding response OmpR family regulator
MTADHGHRHSADHSHGHNADHNHGHSADHGHDQVRTSTVLLYSDDPQVREHMRLAIGLRPAADLAVRFVEASTYVEVFEQVDGGDIDLLMLDGEAAPAGGLGIARQIKDEVDDCPPTCVVIARAADRWLAAYAKVDATLTHPLDPMTTGQAVATMLRERAGGAPARH